MKVEDIAKRRIERQIKINRAWIMSGIEELKKAFKNGDYGQVKINASMIEEIASEIIGELISIGELEIAKAIKKQKDKSRRIENNEKPNK